jgi:predicted lactoylglutathione lyase
MYYAESPEDVDGILRQAQSAGAAVPASPRDRGGVYSGYFQDPDGYLWEILCPLG